MGRWEKFWSCGVFNLWVRFFWNLKEKGPHSTYWLYVDDIEYGWLEANFEMRLKGVTLKVPHAVCLIWICVLCISMYLMYLTLHILLVGIFKNHGHDVYPVSSLTRFKCPHRVRPCWSLLWLSINVFLVIHHIVRISGPVGGWLTCISYTYEYGDNVVCLWIRTRLVLWWCLCLEFRLLFTCCIT